MFKILIFCTITTLNYYLAGASRTNFEIKRLELCNNTQRVIKYNVTITNKNGYQYLNSDIITPVEWGDNLGVTCLIESKVTENNFMELFTIREKNICKAAKKYLGEFWYDILRAAGLPNPTSCPQPAGTYHVHHLKLDFTKISLQTFPFGRLRFTINAITNKNPQIDMGCLLIEVENAFNEN